MIVFCHLLNDSSGSPTILSESIRALKARRLLFVGSQGRGVLEGVSIPVRRYWYRRSNFRIFTLFSFMLSQLQLYRALSRASLPPEAIIYVNTVLPFGAAIWGRRTGRLVIYHIHEVSLSPKILQAFLVWVARKTADLVLYVSEDNRARLRVDGTAASVVPNPVPDRIASAGQSHRYEPMRSGKLEILMLASPRDFKGIPEFLELARRLSDRLEISFSLVLNADPHEVTRYLPASEIPRNIAVFPRSERPEEFYRQADLVLNLSRVDQWIETFGLTLVEAMSFGIPVIAPPVGGPTEIITDGEEGFLIDSRDANLLERKVRLLADNPDVLMQMSEKARRRAKDFSFESFAAHLREALASVKAAKAKKPKHNEISNHR